MRNDTGKKYFTLTEIDFILHTKAFVGNDSFNISCMENLVACISQVVKALWATSMNSEL